MKSDGQTQRSIKVLSDASVLSSNPAIHTEDLDLLDTNAECPGIDERNTAALLLTRVAGRHGGLKGANNRADLGSLLNPYPCNFYQLFTIFFFRSKLVLIKAKPSSPPR